MSRAAVDPSIANFIQSLPKTETHIHIEGAGDVSTALDLTRTGRIQHGIGAIHDETTFQRLLDEEVIQVIRNGFNAALVDASQRTLWLTELEQIESQL